MQLLRSLCRIQAPSGHETALTHFVLDYVRDNKSAWRYQPQIIADERFQDCILLVFGQCGGLCKRLESVVVVFCPVSPAT